MKKASVKLFVPSDLALPYTVEERTTVQVPREKYELEQQLKQASIPFVLICIGNFTSFALDSPYMGIDLPNNRIVNTGRSETNPVWLCSRDYVAAGFAAIFSTSTPAQLAGRLIGLNELRPTTWEIEQAMYDHTGRKPEVAEESIENMTQQAAQGRLDALVRKKMGDGTHHVGQDIWDVDGFPKRSLADFINGSPLDKPPYAPQSEGTLHFLDEYFE